MLRNAVEDAPTPGEDETATIVAATPPAIASDPAWHAHRNARDCRVYGRRLAVGELIEEGDLFEAPTLRSWSPTHFAGQHVTAGTARAYVRPAPQPQGAQAHQHSRSGRMVFGYPLQSGDVLQPGDLFAGAADWIRTRRAGWPAFSGEYLRPVVMSERKEVMEIRTVNESLLFSADVDPSDPMPLRTLMTRMVRERVPFRGAALVGANLEKAVLQGAELAYADLTRADLSHADLRSTALQHARMSGAVLAGADLSEADLSGADLRRADLRDANLFRADLEGADLTGADLKGARLTCADLEDVKLDRTNLDDAKLDEIRHDFWEVLESSPNEVVGFLKKLQAGRIDGSCYEGECACLIGTIAKLRGCNYSELKPDGSRPAEKWMLALQPGNTPANNPVARTTERWVVAWMAGHLQLRMIESVLPPPLRHPAIVAKLLGIK